MEELSLFPSELRIWTARARPADGALESRPRTTPPSPALRVHQHALLRPARDRRPGPRVHGGRLRRPGLPRRAARARSSSPSTAARLPRPASASRWKRGRRRRPASIWRSPRCSRTAAKLRRRGRQRVRAPRCSPSWSAAPPGPPSWRPPSARSRTPPPADRRAIDTDGIKELLYRNPSPALGRRRRPLPDLRQLHDGLPHLLLPTRSRMSPTSRARRRSGCALWDSCFTPTTPTSRAAACTPRQKRGTASG